MCKALLTMQSNIWTAFHITGPVFTSLAFWSFDAFLVFLWTTWWTNNWVARDLRRQNADVCFCLWRHCKISTKSRRRNILYLPSEMVKTSLIGIAYLKYISWTKRVFTLFCHNIILCVDGSLYHGSVIGDKPSSIHEYPILDTYMSLVTRL